jgi:hypothetical protein
LFCVGLPGVGFNPAFKEVKTLKGHKSFKVFRLGWLVGWSVAWSVVRVSLLVLSFPFVSFRFLSFPFVCLIDFEFIFKEFILFINLVRDKENK